MKNSIIENRLVNLSDLSPLPGNANVADEDQLTESLGKHGVVSSIVVNQRTNHVVDGNHRYQQLLAEGATEIRADIIDVDETEELAVAIDLAESARRARWDDGLLLKAFEDNDALRELTTISERQLEELARKARGDLPNADEVPEPPKETISKPGDLWLLGKHRVLCGDSTKAEDVGRLMGDRRAVVMATDPPYVVGYVGGSHPKSNSNRQSSKRDKDWSASYREIDIPNLTAFLTQALTQALTQDAAWYMFHASARQAEVESCWRSVGAHVHQQIIWVKSRSVLTHSHYMWKHEPCFYGWMQGHQPNHRPPANDVTVWEVGSAGNEDAEHPTQKPVALIAKAIGNHTQAGDWAYEPFAGSGTAVIAAESLGVYCAALEISPVYVDVICKRYQQVTGTLPRREDGTEVDFEHA